MSTRLSMSIHHQHTRIRLIEQCIDEGHSCCPRADNQIIRRYGGCVHRYALMTGEYTPPSNQASSFRLS
ncbi:hypothetical protein D3C71_1203900 [compost metagenome]